MSRTRRRVWAKATRLRHSSQRTLAARHWTVLWSWVAVWCFIFQCALFAASNYLTFQIIQWVVQFGKREGRRFVLPKNRGALAGNAFQNDHNSGCPFIVPPTCSLGLVILQNHTLRNISKDDCSCWFSRVPIHLFDMFSVAFKMFQRSSDSFWSPFTVDSIAKSQVAIVQRFPPPVWWIWRVQPLGDMQMCHPPKVFPQRWALCGYWESRFLVSSWNWNALKRMF